MSKQPWYVVGTIGWGSPNPSAGVGVAGERQRPAAPALLGASLGAAAAHGSKDGGYCRDRVPGGLPQSPGLLAVTSPDLGASPDAEVGVGEARLLWANPGRWIFNVFSEVPFCH